MRKSHVTGIRAGLPAATLVRSVTAAVGRAAGCSPGKPIEDRAESTAAGGSKWGRAAIPAEKKVASEFVTQPDGLLVRKAERTRKVLGRVGIRIQLDGAGLAGLETEIAPPFRKIPADCENEMPHLFESAFLKSNERFWSVPLG